MKDIYTKILANPRCLAILDVVPFGKHSILITRINVPAPHRRKGIGTELLERCLADADKEGLDVFIEPAPYGDMTKLQLFDWYRKKGFVGAITGRMLRRAR